jgi:hypothetical protein
VETTPERETESEQSPPRSSRRTRTITIVLFATQGAVLLVASYLWEQSELAGGLPIEFVVFAATCIVVFPAVGSLGVAWAVLGLTKHWEDRRVAAVLLVISLVLATGVAPAFICQGIGFVMRPLVEERNARVARRARVEYQKGIEIHFDSLVERFRQPHRVEAVRPGYFLLDDQSVVKLLYFQDFGSWSPNSVIGREVQVVLPDFDTFKEHYQIGAGDGGWVPRPRESITHAQYGSVPAFVILEGELLNKRFSRFPPGEIDKFFRRHAAVPAGAPIGLHSSLRWSSSGAVSAEPFGRQMNEKNDATLFAARLRS